MSTTDDLKLIQSHELFQLFLYKWNYIRDIYIHLRLSRRDISGNSTVGRVSPPVQRAAPRGATCCLCVVP